MEGEHSDNEAPLREGMTIVMEPPSELTEEERKKKIEELRKKAHEKKLAREEEERKEELRRERDRLKLFRQARKWEQQRAEKEKEKARQLDITKRRQVRLNIKIDAFVRAGKSMEEATALAEEQLRKEEQEAAEKEAKKREELRAQSEEGNTSNPFLVVAPNPVDVLEQIFKEPPPDSNAAAGSLRRMKENSSASVKEALTILQKIISNIYQNPLDTSKRVLKTTTNTFTSKILPFSEFLRILRFCNFDLVEDAKGNKVLMSNLVVMRPLKELLAQF